VKFETDFTKAEWGSFAMLKNPDGNDVWIN